MSEKIGYEPDYPNSLDDAIAMLKFMHNEDATCTDFMDGYRMALRIGINAMEVLNQKGKAK